MGIGEPQTGGSDPSHIGKMRPGDMHGMPEGYLRADFISPFIYFMKVMNKTKEQCNKNPRSLEKEDI